jgi:hypothetical protein
VIEMAIRGFLKEAVARQEAENSVERRLMRFARAREMFDRLRLAGLDEVGNAEFGNRAHRAAERGAGQNAAEMFGFLLGHDFLLEYFVTLSRAETKPQ